MKKLEHILESLGFTDKKAKIYLAILELGEATVLDVAKRTGIKRTTIYNIIPELISEGAIKTTTRRKRRIFYIEDPGSLKLSIDEKIKRLENSLPEFKALQNILPLKPKITYYEDFGGIRDLYQDTLNSSSAGDFILSITGVLNFERMPEDYPQIYVNERVRRKIRTRTISPYFEGAEKWKRTEQKELREMKIVRNSDFVFSADIEIYANKVALVSFKEGMIGVVIESKEIAQMMRANFELMWSLLE